MKLRANPTTDLLRFFLLIVWVWAAAFLSYVAQEKVIEIRADKTSVSSL